MRFELLVTAEEAATFARAYDPLHERGGNELLPSNTVSGYLLAAIMNKRIVEADEDLLGGSNVSLRFERPVLIGEKYEAWVNFFDTDSVKRGKRVVHREIIAYIKKDDSVHVCMKVTQYRRKR